MKVLLTSNASYAPPRGGSTRSNLMWLRHLAAQGHACRVVSAALDGDGECTQDGIRIHSVKDFPRRSPVLYRSRSRRPKRRRPADAVTTVEPARR